MQRHGHALQLVADHAGQCGAEQLDAVGMLLGGFRKAAARGHNLFDKRVLHCSKQNARNIAGCAVMVLIVQAGAVDKMRLLQAHFGSLLIHLLHKGFLRSGSSDRQHNGSLCAGGQHHRINQIPDFAALVCLESRAEQPAGFLRIDNRLRHCHMIVELFLRHNTEEGNQRHHLGHGCRIDFRIGIACKDDLVFRFPDLEQQCISRNQEGGVHNIRVCRKCRNIG